MNTIDNTQVTMVNSASESTTGASSAVAASALSIDSSLLTDGKVDICKLMLEIQKLLGKMVTLLQDYQQKQLAQSYQIQQAVFESQNKAIEEKKPRQPLLWLAGLFHQHWGS
ncbi:espB domain protein [Escherichia coli DEC4B]|nr:espB domain protein [Escherichia coli DEC4B]EHV07917.1 espB domain protein [Escherichia coli DEC4E]EHV44363.1 secreted protein B [Escherichia coli DEC5E]